MVWNLISRNAPLHYLHIKGIVKITAYFLSRDFHSTYSIIIPHQTDSHRYYLLDVFAIIILGMNEGKSKANVYKQSEKWYRWCTFLAHTGVKEKLLDRIPQEDKTTIVLSFESPVQ